MDKKTSRSLEYNFYYWGPFLYKVKLSKEEIKKIKLICKKDKKKDYRKYLVGIIDQEYKIDKDKLASIINPYLISYQHAIKKEYNLNADGKLLLLGAWVNYMKNGESNPIHTHDGDMSFVIYTQVPKKLKKEYDEYSSKYGKADPGTINFITKLNNEFLSIYRHTFFPEEGDFFIFPAKLHHYVNTFKTKCERVSVSGNLKILNK